jgi:hypothetical protein
VTGRKLAKFIRKGLKSGAIPWEHPHPMIPEKARRRAVYVALRKLNRRGLL